MVSKLLAEGLGTFWLVLGGCGSAVLAAAFPDVGIGLLGVSLAFGLTVLTVAYALGPISGGHFNPAVTVGLWAGGRFPASTSCRTSSRRWSARSPGRRVLYVIASGSAGFDVAAGLASNGYGEHSPGRLFDDRRPGQRSRHDVHVPDDHSRRHAQARARRVRAASRSALR